MFMSIRSDLERRIEALQWRMDTTRDPYVRASLSTLIKQLRQEKMDLPLVETRT
ncbi:hypothetical protein [Mesorhizobium sp. B2-5-9]|uniref:hypothetical protein n=1 Tax=Mesorhizobium sp. B2-5-9 TaxID=2589921 RepID=UPI0015E2AA85|nr:hypothetical protein [Mesorhizobium sp. B2-5-9]